MKKTCLIIVFCLFFIPLIAQEPELGLPGDNLNLYGVLNIFQKSPTLEEFEKTLNSEKSQVNNLDLNGDGRIDYIHVIDNVNGSAHAIVLRVDVNETETQDVAVIEVESDVNNQVHVQIVGDESLYGKDYIVEPNQSTPNPAYGGNVRENPTYYSPASWAIIGYMFAPRYVIYRSPYHWGYYPHYWHPWGPFSYHEYYGFHRPYYNHFRRGDTYYSPAAHEYYDHHRVISPIVRERYHSPRVEPAPRNHRESPGIHESPHPANHQPARINQEPRRTNNQPEKVKQVGRPANNQPAKVNQVGRPANNQPAKVNQAPRHTNNQPSKVKQASHPAGHPTKQPAKSNPERKKEPVRK